MTEKINERELTLEEIAIRALRMREKHLFPELNERKLLKELEKGFPSLPLEYIESILRHAMEKYRTYTQMVDFLTEMNRLKLVLGDGRVSLRANAAQYWKYLTRRLDPDLLITRVLARNGIEPRQLFDARGIYWGYQPDIQDVFLRMVFERGLPEVHVHLEGGNPIRCLWLRTMIGLERPRAVRDAAENARLGKGIGLRMLKRACEARRKLQEVLAQFGFNSSYLERWQGRADVLTCRNLLLQERCLLLQAWHLVDREEVAWALAHYSRLKNRFIESFLHTPLDHPGLASFRRYFDAPDILSILRPSRRRRRLHHAWCSELITEGQSLKAVELRISPQNSLRDYIIFFKNVEKNEKEKNEALRSIGVEKQAPNTTKVTFIIHFIRKVWITREREWSSLQRRMWREQMRMSRLSAVLNRFRHVCPAYAARITGVDVANRELGSIPHLYTPWLRLLRGYEDLENVDEDNPFLRPWLALKMEGRHHPSPHMKKLGLTIHVGEEFYHPLEGVMNMEAYIYGARMQAGDRIGHGLASGWDIEAFHRKRRKILMPAGIMLDMMVWLAMTMYSLGLDNLRLNSQLDTHIMELSNYIYNKIYSAHELHEFWKKRHSLPGKYEDQHGERIQMLRGRDPSPDVMQRYLSMRLLPDFLAEQSSFLNELLACWWDEKIRGNGIVVEVNPSSNMSVGNFSSPEDLPGVRRAVETGGSSLCIGSDDPGIFSTSLEHEYALFYEGLIRSGMARHDAQRIIEDVRRNGETVCF